MSGGDDPEVHAVLADYISDERRRSWAVRWLPDIVPEPKELGVMLRNILRDAHVFDSCSALEILVDKEGRNIQTFGRWLKRGLPTIRVATIGGWATTPL